MKKLPAIAMLTAALTSCATHCPPEREKMFRVVPLQYALATEVVKSLGREPKMEIAADTRLNSIVVQGPEVDVVRLERRIRELDIR